MEAKKAVQVLALEHKAVMFTPVQETLAREFAITGSIEEAAHAAGVPKGRASRDLALPLMVARTQEYRDLLAKRLDIRDGKLMAELSAVAGFNIKNLLDGAGDLLPLNEMTDEAMAAITDYSICIKEYGEGASKITVTEKRVRANGKLQALLALTRLKQLDKRPVPTRPVHFHLHEAKGAQPIEHEETRAKAEDPPD